MKAGASFNNGGAYYTPAKGIDKEFGSKTDLRLHKMGSRGIQKMQLDGLNTFSNSKRHTRKISLLELTEDSCESAGINPDSLISPEKCNMLTLSDLRNN